MDGLFRNVTINGKPPNISNWNTSNVISMAYMFNGMWCGYGEPRYDADGCIIGPPKGFEDFPDISKWKVSKVTNMSFMFNDIECKNFPNISKWDISHVTKSENFYSIYSLKDFKNLDEFNKKIKERNNL